MNDTVMVNDRPALRDIRQTLEKAQAYIRENCYHDMVEFDGEMFNGADLVSELQVAESALYLMDRSNKQ